MESQGVLEAEYQAVVLQRLNERGITTVLIAGEINLHLQIIGVIGISDILRPNAAEVVKNLRTNGIERVIMLTGDSHTVAAPIAEDVGVDEFFAELLPLLDRFLGNIPFNKFYVCPRSIHEPSAS